MLQIDDYLELVKRRRTIRKFKPDPIPDEYVDKILEAGRWAMSGANGQPWEFIVVKDPETKRKMGEQYFGVSQRIHNLERMRREELRHPGFAAPPQHLPYFPEAPVLIVVFGDRRTLFATILASHYTLPGEGGGGGDATYLKNMANPVMLMHLAIAALGLGSQWLSVQGLWEPELKALLGVPKDFMVHTVIPVGYPTHNVPESYRRELKELVHYERYDSSKYRTDDDIYNFILDLRKRTRSHYPSP
jgi:5,6-dimethylbenzimidazole synthase